jgi:hypothetical protein
MATLYKPGQPITADGTYYIKATSDTWYNLEATYVGGTATVAISRARGDYGTAVDEPYTLPYDVATAMTFTSGGLTQAIVKSGNVDPWIVFTVSSASGLTLLINARRTDV